MSTPDATASIDTSVLEELRTLATPGGPDLVVEVVVIYLEESPASVEALRAASRSQDARAIVEAAHALKSSSLNVGARRLARLAEELEHLGLRGELAHTGERIEALGLEYTRAREELERLT